jgi:hypothetical protein
MILYSEDVPDDVSDLNIYIFTKSTIDFLGEDALQQKARVLVTIEPYRLIEFDPDTTDKDDFMSYLERVQDTFDSSDVWVSKHAVLGG